MKAKTAGLGATPFPDIWTLPGSVHQMRLHNERSAQPRQPGRPHLARSTWSKRICLPGSPVLWGEGFHFFRWSPPFPPSPPEKLHLGSAWLWRCLWTLCLGFPVFITRKNSLIPSQGLPTANYKFLLQIQVKTSIYRFFSEPSKLARSKATLILPRHKWSHYCLHCGGYTWSFASDFKTCFLKWSTHFESSFLLFLPNRMPFSAEKLI